jgi:hypothetical protein
MILLGPQGQLAAAISANDMVEVQFTGVVLLVSVFGKPRIVNCF